NFLDEEILKMAIAEDIKKTVSVEIEEEIIAEAVVKTEKQEIKAKLVSDEIVPKVIEDKQELIDTKPSADTVAEIKQAPINEPKLEDDPSFNDLLEENPSRDDLFSNVRTNQEILDLNRKLAEARGNHSLAEKLQNQQIENLKSVIGINDKFYFINELFGGDSTKYEDVIYTLNNFKRLDDAMQYFSTLKYRFNWNEESEAPEKLIKMLERKFDLVTD
ncbi:MAG: hypothetical protein KAH25_06875, partial [Bacteroidales bacterium]|nr:hypothetical protein [Bacteroidales bacterium]